MTSLSEIAARLRALAAQKAEPAKAKPAKAKPAAKPAMAKPETPKAETPKGTSKGTSKAGPPTPRATTTLGALAQRMAAKVAAKAPEKSPEPEKAPLEKAPPTPRATTTLGSLAQRMAARLAAAKAPVIADAPPSPVAPSRHDISPPTQRVPVSEVVPVQTIVTAKIEGKVPVAAVWKKNGTAKDLENARAFAMAEGYTVFTYSTSEKDPIGRAKEDVSRMAPPSVHVRKAVETPEEREIDAGWDDVPSARAPSLRAPHAAAHVTPPSAHAPPNAPPKSKPAKLDVAREILEQLGGNKFLAMTGATNVVGSPNGVQFKLPARSARDGINRVQVTLEPTDTYTVRFTKVGAAPNFDVKEIAVVENVYADSLQAVFKSHTGLDTTMGAIQPGSARVVQAEAKAPSSTKYVLPSFVTWGAKKSETKSETTAASSNLGKLILSMLRSAGPLEPHQLHGLLVKKSRKGHAPSHADEDMVLKALLNQNEVVLDSSTPNVFYRLPDQTGAPKGPPPAKPAKPKTFAQVKDMLLAGLAKHGWKVTDGLKVPHATKGNIKLWFKAQAIYMGFAGGDIGSAHSLSSDMRADYPDVESLIRDAERRDEADAKQARSMTAPYAGTPAPAVQPSGAPSEGARSSAPAFDDESILRRARIAFGRYLDSVAAIVRGESKTAADQLEIVADEVRDKQESAFNESAIDALYATGKVPVGTSVSQALALLCSEKLRALAKEKPPIVASILRRAALGIHGVQGAVTGPTTALAWSKIADPDRTLLAPIVFSKATRDEAARIDAELERLQKAHPGKRVNPIRESIRGAIQMVREACKGAGEYGVECEHAREMLAEALRARRVAIGAKQVNGDLFAGFTKPKDVAAAKQVVKDIEALSRKIEAIEPAPVEPAPEPAPPSAKAPPSVKPASVKPASVRDIVQALKPVIEKGSVVIPHGEKRPYAVANVERIGKATILALVALSGSTDGAFRTVPLGDVKLAADQTVTFSGSEADKLRKKYLSLGGRIDDRAAEAPPPSSRRAMDSIRIISTPEPPAKHPDADALAPQSVRTGPHPVGPHPVIDSIAKLRRLPIGTKLYVIRSMLGPNEPSGRVLKAVRSKDLVFRIDDPSSKNDGQDSYLGLAGSTVEPTANGFRILGEGQVTAEYEFAGETASPTLSAPLAKSENPAVGYVTTAQGKKKAVDVLARDRDLFVHAALGKEGKFSLSHDGTGGSLGTFDSVDEAMALAMDVNRPELRALFDRAVGGDPEAGKELRRTLDLWAPEQLQRYLAAKAAHAPSKSPSAGTASSPFEPPTDLQTEAKRRDANLAAMRLAAELKKNPRPLTDDDRRTLAAYSGWGGLHLKTIADAKFPADFPRPEARGLIHEYYTPTNVCAEVARITKPHLEGLVAGDGKIHALEPSAGIGRFIRAFMGPGFELITWHAVEYSKLSANMLHALNPEVDLFQGPFEKWVAQNEKDYKGRLNLVVSNPPYGERGAAITDDPDRSYRDGGKSAAYKYFLRRGLDLLAPGGMGVYLIPPGFMSSRTPEYTELRKKVLLKHHLICAFRLPGDIFPGALNKAFDVVFFRKRRGTLKTIDPVDQAILDGRYYFEYPAHILGKEVEQAGKWKNEVYVVGEFNGLPDLRERPICASCETTPESVAPAPAPKDEKPSNNKKTPAKVLEGTDSRLASAASLGHRVDNFLATVAAQDNETPALAWEELHRGLVDWATLNGPPSADVELVKLAKEDAGAARFLTAFLPKTTKIIPALTTKPAWSPRYTGRQDDVLARAEFLYRQHRKLHASDLHGLDVAPLFAAGWCQDGSDLVPEDVYYYGDLWPKYDRAKALAEQGSEQGQRQATKLIELIKPEIFDDIQGVSPRQGWVPLHLIEQWLEPMNRNEPVKLAREEGIVQIVGHKYEDLENARGVTIEVIQVVGWINHDKTLFKPFHTKSEDIDDARLRIAKEWEQSFRAWCSADDTRRAQIEATYQRVFQGFRAPSYSSEPLTLTRWSPAIQPKPHQNAGASRVLANRGGLLAFDVGVGKTYTGLMIAAAARQAGWVKRPVVLVPNSIVWKWVRDIQRALPDYRVGVVGSKRVTITRGPRKGYLTSDTDEPAERAATWSRFQGGEYDIVVMTYTALSRTKMDEQTVLAYVKATTAIERMVTLRKRNAGKKAESGEERAAKGKKSKDPKKNERGLTEREEAILEEGMAAWVAEQMELQEGWEYDPGITWDDIGIDMLIVDEAQNFKNLYSPEEREGGVPRFMGSAGTDSKRAWQLDFRTAAVRRKTGGAGIVLLSATPAKNSPLEFYNLIQYIDHDAFSRRGIFDTEQFIDRYCKIEMMDVIGTNLDVVSRGAVVGFHNLHELREIVFRYGDFKTAEDVGLKLPNSPSHFVQVAMNHEQEAKYETYVKQIEDALENPFSSKGAILGALARMSLVSIHPALDEKYTSKTAKDVPDPHSPKFDAVAKNVLQQPHCGHIIFCDNIAAHVWMKMVLVEAGIPAARIALLNAEAAPQAADRQRIAEAFNGNPDEGIDPLYDVVIANAVAYEGVDLQVRTCGIHHIDLPWEPATLQQRNGRGVRQGNTLASIAIYYYFALRSQDAQRFALIKGKRGWMTALVKGQDRSTNNPGAALALSPEDILLLISRDPEKTKARFEEVRARREEEARAKIADEASATLRGAVARFTQARTTTDVEKASRLRSEGEQRLEDLAKVDPVAWPWAAWAMAARDHAMLVPPNGASPVYEGLRLGKPNAYDPQVIDYVEFGRTFEGKEIGVRAAGKPNWTSLTIQKVAEEKLRPEFITSTWPADDDDRMTTRMRDFVIPSLSRSTAKSVWNDDIAWHWASDAFVEHAWKRFGRAILDAFDKVPEWRRTELTIPVVASGYLFVGIEAPFERALPPTLAGWHEFLRLAPASSMAFGVLEDAARFWWGRPLPRSILAAATPEQKAAREGAEKAVAEREAAEKVAKARAEAARKEQERIELEKAMRAREEREERERLAKVERLAARAKEEAAELERNPHATVRFVTSKTAKPEVRQALRAIDGYMGQREGSGRHAIWPWFVPMARAAEARAILGED